MAAAFIAFIFVVSVYTLVPIYLNSQKTLAGRRSETGGEAHRQWQRGSVIDRILKVTVSVAGLIVLVLFILTVLGLVFVLSFDIE